MASAYVLQLEDITVMQGTLETCGTLSILARLIFGSCLVDLKLPQRKGAGRATLTGQVLPTSAQILLCSVAELIYNNEKEVTDVNTTSVKVTLRNAANDKAPLQALATHEARVPITVARLAETVFNLDISLQKHQIPSMQHGRILERISIGALFLRVGGVL
jgi:hypothetical protein